jgi:hypothetical protein
MHAIPQMQTIMRSRAHSILLMASWSGDQPSSGCKRMPAAAATTKASAAAARAASAGAAAAARAASAGAATKASAGTAEAGGGAPDEAADEAAGPLYELAAAAAGERRANQDRGLSTPADADKGRPEPPPMMAAGAAAALAQGCPRAAGTAGNGTCRRPVQGISMTRGADGAPDEAADDIPATVRTSLTAGAPGGALVGMGGTTVALPV